MSSGAVTVSGPGIDSPAASRAVGVSRAITHASRASKRREPCSFYVRDAQGVALVRVDVDEAGVVTVHPLTRSGVSS